ncbi:urease accessory protein UreD [Micrococcus lacusdianchii]|uniref:urease accessory protein UreD n=1 Tax=Micrococcus lacusdianchii TaxID=2915940 RepID=UPI002003D3A0
MTAAGPSAGPDAEPEGTGAACTGRLALRIGQRGGRSVAVEQFHEGALRVLRPHRLDDSGQVCFVVVNPGGGYLGADRYEMDVRVEDGASLLLTTQSATKVYRTPQGPAVQRTRLRLGAGARLETVPDQLIAYRDAEYVQDTVVDLHPTSSMCLTEIVTPGWDPGGERFSYSEVQLRTLVMMQGRPVLLDNLLIRPEWGVSGVGVLEGHSHVGSLVVVDPRADEEVLAAVRACAEAAARACAGPALAAVTSLAVPGLVLRVLGDSTGDVGRVLADVAAQLRALWCGQPPLALRKY